MTTEERRAAVQRVLADWPPLTDDQRARLTRLLRPARTATPSPGRIAA